MINTFTNPRVVPWYKWIISKKTESCAVVIYFLSRRYGTSPRFFPLYNEFSQTDIVLFRGSRLPMLDRLYLKLLPIFIILFRQKLSRYKAFIALNSSKNLVVTTNMILNLDDPMYTKDEIVELREWESAVREKGFESVIVCTNQHARDYLRLNEIESFIEIIPQGHSLTKLTRRRTKLSKGDTINLVYSSPSIDVVGDRHEGHKMWDCSILLQEIWPNVKAQNLRLHLIGRLGENARLILRDKRVISYGLVSVQENSQLLQRFDAALYPRTYNNNWMPQKLIEYMGAGLPILAFELGDTRIVKDLNIGITVNSISDFINLLDSISINPGKLHNFHLNSRTIAMDYSWKNLAIKYEALYNIF